MPQKYVVWRLPESAAHLIQETLRLDAQDDAFTPCLRQRIQQATAAIQPVTEIHVAAIDHRHGTDLYAALSEAELDSQLAGYCRVWWGDLDDPGDPPKQDEEVITAYFDRQAECGDEWLRREAVALYP